ncbi:hypothetical protein [Zoogloea sp.]|uniref:hypothetical protein n=1 Tax=Zoogloea sp. TaxID=49181 RepID=UPI002639B174|nr:hypothetical protein [Zoogloea sp.]
MTYFVDVFSVATYEEFSCTDKAQAGFHPKRRAWVTKIKPGDKLLCYLKGVSCWIGVLEVTGPMVDNGSEDEADEFSLKFPVKPLVWLGKGQLLPIKREDVWAALSFTKNIAPGAGGWNAIVRSSGVRLPSSDGEFLEQRLASQQQQGLADGIADDDWEKLRGFKVEIHGKSVSVEIPEPDITDEESAQTTDTAPSGNQVGDSNASAALVRTSHKMQAHLADIGLAMGFQVWIPKADREPVLSEMLTDSLLESLPFTQFSNAEPTLKTIEQIDVLWLSKKTIVRAFEVEHTTAVYSGILRMADLLALQPNFHTRLHIVAPEERRKKVFQELRRPAFSVFEQGPLSKLCSYLPYEKVQELAEDPNLEYLKPEVLDKLEEWPGE